MNQASRIADTQALIERLPVMAVSLRNSPWSFKGEAERIEQAAAELARLLDDNERLRAHIEEQATHVETRITYRR